MGLRAQTFAFGGPSQPASPPLSLPPQLRPRSLPPSLLPSLPQARGCPGEPQTSSWVSVGGTSPVDQAIGPRPPPLPPPAHSPPTRWGWPVGSCLPLPQVPGLAHYKNQTPRGLFLWNCSWLSLCSVPEHQGGSSHRTEGSRGRGGPYKHPVLGRLLPHPKAGPPCALETSLKGAHPQGEAGLPCIVTSTQAALKFLSPTHAPAPSCQLWVRRG